MATSKTAATKTTATKTAATSKTTASKPEGQWTATELASRQIGVQTWKAQALTAPDGKEYLSLRAFAKKQDGTVYQTQHGFTLAVESLDPKAFAKINSLLKVLHTALNGEAE